MTRIISIEGNIGTGKSRFIKELEEQYNTGSIRVDLSVHFLQEPVDLWESVKNKDGKTILECYYHNKEKYAFSFQMMAYLSRINLLMDALKHGYDIIVTERCVHTDKHIFAKMLYDMEHIEEVEYKIYNMWFEHFLPDIPPVEIVYMVNQPSISHSRVLQRNRSGEADISIDYLEQCHHYHEQWLSDREHIRIDACHDICSEMYTHNIHTVLQLFYKKY